MTTAPHANHLELMVSNLGPIAEGKIQLRPMSVFVGPSNTGKSYLATLIYALHRFFGRFGYVPNTAMPMPTLFGWRPTLMPLTSINLSAEDIDDLYDWDIATRSRMELEAVRQSRASNYESELPETVSVLVRRALLGAVKDLGKVLDDEIVRCFGVGKTESLVHYPSNGGSNFSLLSLASDALGYSDAFSYEIMVEAQGVNIKAAIPNSIPVQIVQSARPRWFALLPEDIYDGRKESAGIYLTALSGGVLSRSVGPLGQPAHYLPTDRAGALRSHQALVGNLIANASRTATQVASLHPTLSGVYGDFLERLVTLGDPLAQRDVMKYPLALNLEQDILGGAIHIESNLVGYPSFVYHPEGWERDLPLMNTSSMVSELAPVVLYLRHVVEPGDTLIIEEPESHLHPAMQVEFVRLLAAAVKAGIRIIITTHSEWVLEELANLVLMSELPVEHRAGIEGADLALTPDEVGAWFFEPDHDRSGSVVNEIPLDKEMGKFPSEFGLVTAELYNRFAKISNRIERLSEE